MPQNVPEFRFSDDALRLRQFLYEHWCAHGRGPNLRAAHQATGLTRERLIEVYRELDLGLICTVDHATQNCNLLKLQPFSSYPSQVEVFVGGKFHSWAGCAMESVALSRMPPFAGKEVRLESYCACCLAPVSLATRDGDIVSRVPEPVLIHVSTSPREWNTTNIVCMCDSMNYVADAEHAGRRARAPLRAADLPPRRPLHARAGAPLRRRHGGEPDVALRLAAGARRARAHHRGDQGARGGREQLGRIASMASTPAHGAR